MAWETLALDSRRATAAGLPACVFQDEIEGWPPSEGGSGTDETSNWSGRQRYEVDLGGGVVAASYRAAAEPVDYEAARAGWAAPRPTERLKAGERQTVSASPRGAQQGSDGGSAEADVAPSDTDGDPDDMGPVAGDLGTTDVTADDSSDVAGVRGTRGDWLERLGSAQATSRRITAVGATHVSKAALAAQQAGRQEAEVVAADPGLSKEGDDAGGAGGDADVTPEGSATERRWGRGRYGTKVGSAVHAVLQHVDLAANAKRGDHERLDGLEQLVEAETTIAHAKNHQADVKQLLTQALSSDVVLRAGRGRHYQELYVGAPIEAAGSAVTVEGFIDLLYECPETGRLVVVDYKTDAVDAAIAEPAARPADDTGTDGVPGGSAGDAAAASAGNANGAVSDGSGAHLNRSLEERLSYYTPQGATYAHCVQQATGRPVERVEFLFISATGTETGIIEGDELREALAALPTLVQAASTAE